MTLAERLYSVEDLLTMEEGDAYELDDGVLKELPVGFESEEVAVNLIAEMRIFLRTRHLGRIVPPNVGLHIFPDRPGRMPRADGGFISYAALSSGPSPRGFLTSVPELLVEAISPGDNAAYMRRKTNEYLAAGVRLVWVLFPDTRMAEVFRADGTASVIPPEGALDGEDVIPGFRCELATIMPPAEPS